MKNILQYRKILIVEDNPLNIQLLGTILQEYNPKIIVATNGLQALKSANDLQPDIILMDVNMPDMDGYETCRQLKKNKATRHIPVLFLTGRSSTDDIIEGFRSGGVDYIQKPYIEAELIARIQTHLKLQMSRQSMEELIRTKDRYFGIIAHDLKNPFLNIVGYSEYIQENIANIDKKELVRYVNNIFQSAFAQNRLLDNLLEWSAFQTGNFTYNREQLDIHEVVADIYNLYQQVAITKEIRLINKAQSHLNIWADKPMLNTILRNLVSNAVKFTPAGKEICISSAIKNNSVEISVNDQGIGMSEELIQQIFAEDRQVTHYGTDGEKGTGLGLKLCKEFVNRNNGTIGVKSEKDIGSTFTLTFPTETNKEMQ